jgi:hypothetical protein
MASEMACLGGLLAIVVVVAIVTAVTVVIAVIIASLVSALVAPAWRAILPGWPGEVFTMTRISLLSSGILLGGGEHLSNGCRRLSVELSVELMVVVEIVDEGGDEFRLEDVRSMVPNLRESRM